MSRKLLKDVFSNLALSAWARHSALLAAQPFHKNLACHCMGQEVTGKVGFGASTEATGLAVPHGVHCM